MQRAVSGGEKDPLAQLLSSSCYGDMDVAAVLALGRLMIQQYRSNAPMADVVALTPRLLSLLPPARTCTSSRCMHRCPST